MKKKIVFKHNLGFLRFKEFQTLFRRIFGKEIFAILIEK